MVKAQDLDALLPQTQCGECGYPGCMPYAQALASGMAPIDRCPPGGEKTLRALSSVLNIDPTPYIESIIERTRTPAQAVIREAECIGCTKCIQACPVDAIIGAGKLMHTILADECTGCGLCVEPCPVDCIDLLPMPNNNYDPAIARKRYNDRHVRLLRQEQQKQQAYRERRQLNTTNSTQEQVAKLDYIAQALQRVKNKNI
jgi:Na+-translocating ferredoxin:NAD+ oxidoreductase subunit B